MKTKHCLKWQKTFDNPNRILIILDSESGKPKALITLISHHPGIGKIYLYAKDRYETQEQF